MSRIISLLAMGGTVSTRRGPAGAVPDQDAERIAEVAHLPDGVQIRTRDVARMPSRSVTPADMAALAAVVRADIAAGAAGVVITHGTDTMEETAYALAMLVPTDVPVVLTGSMRTPDEPGPDGPANLSAAVSAAADPRLAGYGPVVVHQDEIHLARWVTKLYTNRVAAFGSPVAGPVGFVSEGRVVLTGGPAPGRDLLPVTADPRSRVELIWMTAGADGLLVDAIDGSVDGLVVAGAGGGHTTEAMAASLIRVVRSGTPVVLASRCAAGEVLTGTYGGPGSERQLLADGLHRAGALSPLKARLRLLFGLSAGTAAADLFEPWVATG